MPNLLERVRQGWQAFKSPETEFEQEMNLNRNAFTIATSARPDIIRAPNRGSERSIVNSIYTRISMDVAAIQFEHVTVDPYNERYTDTVKDSLNDCLTLEANIDQTGRAFIQDICLTMFHDREGCIAVCPVLADKSPLHNTTVEIYELRVAQILEWKPRAVKCRLYNDITGQKSEQWWPKSAIAIIENPFAPVMNAPNSTLQRLIRKLNILDAIDEQSGAGKLDLIIQLPYTIKSEARKKQAEERRKSIEEQLANGKYGIAYTDATEHVTQINRAVENNLMNQIEYLTNMVYSQLGLTTAVMDGTADEQQMLNYYSRTIEPIASAISNEFRRKFLSKTARTQGHDIMFFRDPFKLVPVEKIAEIADKFTRNEIMTSNEIRAIVGYKPSSDPNADELRNKNLNQSDAALQEEQMIGAEDQYAEDQQYE